jgi:hypothetical protein
LPTPSIIAATSEWIGLIEATTPGTSPAIAAFEKSSPAAKLRIVLAIIVESSA